MPCQDTSYTPNMSCHVKTQNIFRDCWTFACQCRRRVAIILYYSDIFMTLVKKKLAYNNYHYKRYFTLRTNYYTTARGAQHSWWHSVLFPGDRTKWPLYDHCPHLPVWRLTILSDLYTITVQICLFNGWPYKWPLHNYCPQFPVWRLTILSDRYTITVQIYLFNGWPY